MCTCFFGRWFSDCGSVFLGVPHSKQKTNVLFLGPPPLSLCFSSRHNNDEKLTKTTNTNSTASSSQAATFKLQTFKPHQSFIMSDVPPEKSICDSSAEDEEQFEEMLVSFAAGLVSCVALMEGEDENVGRAPGSKNVKRERVAVETIFSRLGPRFVRKAYRMTEFSFWKLLGLLKDHLPKESKRKRGATPVDSGAKLQTSRVSTPHSGTSI